MMEADAVTKSEAIARELERALRDADGSDRWHKHGEGYNGLRADVQKAIATLRSRETSQG